jgi:hypothetical protein
MGSGSSGRYRVRGEVVVVVLGLVLVLLVPVRTDRPVLLSDLVPVPIPDRKPHPSYPLPTSLSSPSFLDHHHLDRRPLAHPDHLTSILSRLRSTLARFLFRERSEREEEIVLVHVHVHVHVHLKVSVSCLVPNLHENKSMWMSMLKRRRESRKKKKRRKEVMEISNLNRLGIWLLILMRLRGGLLGIFEVGVGVGVGVGVTWWS